jgi:DNA-binding transcriptional MerR regulator
MGLVSDEFFKSNENLSKDELEDLLGVNARTFRYYKENSFIKGTRTKRKGRYTFSPREIDFLGFIRDLRNAGLSPSEIKKIDGIYKIPNTNNGRQLLKLYESLEELFQKIEFKKRELEQLKKDILGFKKNLRNFDELSEQHSDT